MRTSMPNSRVTLYIPGLAAVLLRAGADHRPLLEKFFSRAESRQVSNEVAILAECFGLNAESLAIAPLERFADVGRRDEGCWWRADPVHLTADRDQLVMLPQAALAVTGDEARKLAETFNQSYGAEGFVLETPQPDRWYLRVPVDWHCRSWNPMLVKGQAVAEFMPSGADENPVRKLMTEIQMLLHEHPVNQAREAAGQPTINSLWLWGGGRLSAQVEHALVRITTSLPLVRGLARLAGQIGESWPADFSAPSVAGDWLIALSIQDFDGDASRLESGLLAPLWRALLRGRIQQIRFYPGGDHLYELTRRSARRFWRRARPMSERLREPNE